MIVYENTIYCTPGELDVLKQHCTPEELDTINQSAESAGLHFAGASIKVVSEAFLQLAKAFDPYGDLQLSLTALGQKFKPEPKRYRCRICGRKYDFKSDAKGCMRDHKQRRR